MIPAVTELAELGEDVAGDEDGLARRWSSSIARDLDAGAGGVEALAGRRQQDGRVVDEHAAGSAAASCRGRGNRPAVALVLRSVSSRLLDDDLALEAREP